MNKNPVFKLADVTTLITDGKHGDCRDESGSGFFFLSSKDLRDGRLHYDDPREIRPDDFLETHRRTNLKPGDILLANCGASIGRVGVAQHDERICRTTFQKSISVIKADRKLIDSKYLYFFCVANSRHFVDLGGGTAQPNLLIGDLKRIKIHLPPFPVQKKIAAILAAYDELIENNKRRIALLEKMAEEIYREWFVRLRFPGHKKVKGVPEGWEQKRLPELANIIYGFPFDGSRFNANGRGKPIIRIRNIPESATTDYTDEVADEKYIVHHGDLIVGMDGEFHINHWHGDEAYLVQRVCRIKAKNPMLEGYLAHAIRAPIKHFESVLMGATVGHLGAIHLKSIVLLVPPQHLQEQLRVLNDIYLQKLLLAKASRNLSETRDRLLPRFISGKLSVENLDIQFPPGMAEEMKTEPTATAHASWHQPHETAL